MHQTKVHSVLLLAEDQLPLVSLNILLFIKGHPVPLLHTVRLRACLLQTRRANAVEYETYESQSVT